MPVEIKELVIRTTIGDSDTEPSDECATQVQEIKEEIIAEALNRMADHFREIHER